MSMLTKLPIVSYARDAFAGFRPDGAFDLGTARALMWLSQLAYESDEPAKVVEIARGWDLAVAPDGVISVPIISSLPLAKAVAVVARTKTCTLVAFAGTDPLVLADWIADFDIAKTDSVANGFAIAAAAALPAVRGALAGTDVPILVAGHSLGGAISVITADAFAAEGRSIVSVYTFGMPRPGGEAFCARYNAALGRRTYRLVHGIDIVPTVAPSFLGFRHVGRRLACKQGASFAAEDVDPEPGSDAPPFRAGMAGVLLDHIRLAVRSPAAALAGLNPQNHWPLRPAPLVPLLQLLPPDIKAHLQDNYLAALSPTRN